LVGNAADDVWVMLDHVGEDSVVYKRKPDYIGRSNESGAWSMSFLPADSFEVYALKDDNANFLYDQDTELFGWLEENIYTGDQIAQLPPIMIFPREGRVIVKEVIHVVPGWMKIVMDAPFPKPLPVLLPAIDTSVYLWDKDTLNLWYSPDRNYSGYVVLENDSTIVKQSGEPSMITQPILIKPVSGRLHPGGKAVFTLNVPVASIDASQIFFQPDSITRLPVVAERDSYDLRKFSITAPWITESRNSIVFLPGAITDVWGRVNDTVRHSVVVSNAEQFGDLFMSIDGLDSTRQYILLLKEGEQIIDTFVVEGKSESRIVKNGLIPAKYTIEVIEDVNRNGVWDTGNYEARRQPEKKMIFSPEGLRAGWEQEVKMTWK